MSRKKIKQVDAIRQKTLENVIEEFLRHCRLKNLSPRTLEYYEEDLSYFQRSVPVESVREVTREVMEDFIDHEMQKGNRITAINTRLRGLRVFFRFCQEREYMGDIGLKLLKEDETIKEPYPHIKRRCVLISSHAVGRPRHIAPRWSDTIQLSLAPHEPCPFRPERTCHGC